MPEKIRILGIAPYPGMKTQMQKIAEEFPDVELVALQGDLQKGVIAAQNRFHSDFDLIISRGGTAQMLRAQVDLPVVEIEITEYDVLRCIRLAENVSGRYAVVGFSNITDHFRDISELVNENPSIFTIGSADDADTTMDKVYRLGFTTVICDVAANASAKRHGLNAVLICSSPKSIRKAFDESVRMAKSQQRLQSENRFLKEIIYRHSNDTVIFDDKGNLYFSTVRAENNAELMNVLKEEISSCQTEKSARIVKCLNGNLYTIKAQKLIFSSREFPVFSVSKSKAPFLSAQSGIHYYTQQQVRQTFYTSLFVSANDLFHDEKNILHLRNSDRPLMILGESGTGKESAAKLIYVDSKVSGHPFVEISCSLLNAKTWEFLEGSHHSPLADSDLTVFFADLETLPEERLQHLLAVLLDMDVCRRNRVFFSCRQDEYGAVPKQVQLFADKLCCLTYVLEPLRKIRDKIPALINLYLSQLSVTDGTSIIGLDRQATEMMQNFEWFHNFAQFKRVMQELVTRTKQPVISGELVASILELEKTSPITQDGHSEVHRFDLNRTMEEMESEIIRLVLKECNGNQTLAAKRLGISRTTVWRFSSCENVSL